jgi:hypothetical protein
MAAAQSAPAFSTGGTFGATTPASPFGGSAAFGTSPAQPSHFGQPGSAGGFGSVAQPGLSGAFGNRSVFGQPITMGGAGFGQAATPGVSLQPAAAAVGAVPFGSPASPNLQQASAGNQ